MAWITYPSCLPKSFNSLPLQNASRYRFCIHSFCLVFKHVAELNTPNMHFMKTAFLNQCTKSSTCLHSFRMKPNSETKTSRTYPDSQKPVLHLGFAACVLIWLRDLLLAEYLRPGVIPGRRQTLRKRWAEPSKVCNKSTWQAFWEKMLCCQTNLFLSIHRWRSSIIKEFYLPHGCQNRIQSATQVNTVFYQHECYYHGKYLFGLNTMSGTVRWWRSKSCLRWTQFQVLLEEWESD